MKASELTRWPVNLHPSEWPEGTLEHMDADLFTKVVWPTRAGANVPMWPSKLYDAHVRTEGNSAHSTQGGTRLSYGTDMHTKTYTNLMKVFSSLVANPEVGGIGLYFDTNSPMVHMDTRPQRLVWLRINGEYIYEVNNPVLFWIKLGEALEGKA